MTVLRGGLLDSEVEVAGPAQLLEALSPLLPASRPREDVLPRQVRLEDQWVLVDGLPAYQVLDPDAQLETVLVALNAIAIEEVRTFAVHAGVVALGGLVVAWPGVSGAGKSTLTAACLQAGFQYVSDEALVLDEGRVRCYPKWISLDAWSLAALHLPPPPDGRPERPVPVDEVGAPAPADLHLGHLVVLDRRPGPADLRPASAALSASLLLQHSFNHYKDPLGAFREATAAAREADSWSLGYDRPEDGARALLDLVEQGPHAER